MKNNIGDIVEGKITGIKPYGAFISFDHGHIGLIHISEISDRFVKDISDYVTKDEVVVVKIIDYDSLNNQYHLSLKALQKNRKTKFKYQPKPELTIGFKTLKDKLPVWIKGANND